MKSKFFTRCATLFLFAAIILGVPAYQAAIVPSALMQPNISVNGLFAMEKAQRGRPVQAAVVLDIPQGFHVNANKPLGKYAVATVLRVEAPGGIKISPVTYPRSSMHRVGGDQLAVYDGRAVMRFNVTVPANYESNAAELRARIKFQSCNDDVCFPPVTREITMPIDVAKANEAVKRVNGEVFGGGRGRRR
ncbi:MAG: hypothetical protein H0T92_15895 [Pyrinomonadaceae bacterium]|nr:hypothetical protein [Pyrinomonadaceae bacterium]